MLILNTFYYTFLITYSLHFFHCLDMTDHPRRRQCRYPNLPKVTFYNTFCYLWIKHGDISGKDSPLNAINDKDQIYAACLGYVYNFLEKGHWNTLFLVLTQVIFMKNSQDVLPFRSKTQHLLGWKRKNAIKMLCATLLIY
jgi:hypothetical protein